MRVKCINNECSNKYAAIKILLTENAIYDVVSDSGHLYKIVNDFGVAMYYAKRRFEEIS